MHTRSLPRELCHVRARGDTHTGLILVSWKVAGRLKRLIEQAACVLSESPDVVCLQEVTKSSAPLWVEALRAGGFEHVLLADIAARPDARRPLGVLTAAREPVTEVPVPSLPWPERVLSVQLGGTEVLNVHSPVSPSPGLAKVLTHEALFDHLAAAAEQLALLRGLEQHGFRDAYRELHGWDHKNPSGSGRNGVVAIAWTTWWCRRTWRSRASSTGTSGARICACPITRLWSPRLTRASAAVRMGAVECPIGVARRSNRPAGTSDGGPNTPPAGAA